MNLLANMEYSFLEKKKLKTFCLKRKLKILTLKKQSEIQNIITLYPKEASRMDFIEKSFPSQALEEVDLKIKAVSRLLKHISKN